MENLIFFSKTDYGPEITFETYLRGSTPDLIHFCKVNNTYVSITGEFPKEILGNIFLRYSRHMDWLPDNFGRDFVEHVQRSEKRLQFRAWDD